MSENNASKARLLYQLTGVIDTAPTEIERLRKSNALLLDACKAANDVDDHDRTCRECEQNGPCCDEMARLTARELELRLAAIATATKGAS